MANKQIKDLDLIGNNINAASDFLIIQKADGSTYKVTVDQLINSSTTVSYGSSTGAPTVISESWTTNNSDFSKTITVTNMFDTTSAGVLNLELSNDPIWGLNLSQHLPGTEHRTNHIITKAAGLNMISFGGQSISVGGPEIQIESGLHFRLLVGNTGTRKLFLYVSCTKNSLTIRSQRFVKSLVLGGQISIVPS